MTSEGTRRRARAWAAPVVVVLLLWACGDTGVGAGATDTGAIADVSVADLGPLPTDPLDAALLAGELAAATCAFRITCEPIFERYIPESRAECEARQGASLRQYFEALAPLVADGRVGFSREAFDACLGAWDGAASDCARGVDPFACQDYIQGRTPQGAACGSTAECAPGHWCDLEASGGCGVCRARAQSGQSCADSVCDVGLDCFDFQSQGARCAPVTADLGATCGTPTTGLCRGSLQCAGASSLTCVAPAALGAACDPTGEAADCDVFAGAVCGPDDVCVAIDIVDPPATCGEDALSNLCASDARCDTATRKCVALPSEGGACSQAIACAPGHFCGSDLKCHAEVGQGAVCGASAQCQEPLYCIDGSCQPIRFAATCP